MEDQDERTTCTIIGCPNEVTIQTSEELEPYCTPCLQELARRAY